MPERPVLTLLAYVFVLAPGMLLGFYFARRKLFTPYHKLTMTTITVVNWFLIVWLMLSSYASGVLPNVPAQLGQPQFLLPTLHAITGGIAQLLATYLVILMWTERTSLERILPVRIRNIKTPMRVTLGLWLTTIVLGVAIFAVWYSAPPAGAGVDAVSTEEAQADPQATEEATAAPEAEETPAVETTEPAATEDASEEAPAPASTEASG
jgi:uncharacterized membrane protein YozB (DUF420 family)